MSDLSELNLRVYLKQLLESNKSTLVDGLSFQGVRRQIHQITYSALTPPQVYYFVVITVRSDSAFNRSGFGSTKRVGPSSAEYEVNIEIADYAVAQPGEENVYEKMDADFRILTDRIVDLIRLQETFEINNLIFELDENREVTKTNLDTIWSENSSYHGMLYARIDFTVLQKCI